MRRHPSACVPPQAYLPLIAAVCNPGLHERHWTALADLVGFTIKQVGLVRCLCARVASSAGVREPIVLLQAPDRGCV